MTTIQTNTPTLPPHHPKPIPKTAENPTSRTDAPSAAGAADRLALYPRPVISPYRDRKAPETPTPAPAAVPAKPAISPPAPGRRARYFIRTTWITFTRWALTQLLSVLNTRAYHAFSKQLAQAQAANRATLDQILTREQATEFGKKHHFETIRNSADPVGQYQANIPLSTYADYRTDIERMAEGQNKVLTHKKTTFFALTSGTTGKPKKIPMTSTTRKKGFECAILMSGILNRMNRTANASIPALNLLSMAGVAEKTAGGIPMGNATSGSLSQTPETLLAALFTTPPEAMKIADQSTAHMLHLIFGLSNPKLKCIQATFAPYVVKLFDTLEKQWPTITESIRTGKLPDSLNLPATLKQSLERQLLPNPKRAAAVERECETGMDNIAIRLWPKLTHVAAVGTGSFGVYVPQLTRYIGQVPLYHGTFSASEGIFGISTSKTHPNEFTLMPNQSFYEFIPANQIHQPNPKICTLDQVIPGQDYEMVVTTHAGFYRYRMGDIITVKRLVGESPAIEFAYRSGTLLNLAGEKTTEAMTTAGLNTFAREFLGSPEQVIDFTIIPKTDTSPPHYQAVVELASPDYLESPDFRTLARDALDQALGQANPDIPIMQNTGLLGKTEISFAAPGGFSRLLDYLKTRNGGMNTNQAKIPRLISAPDVISRLYEELH